MGCEPFQFPKSRNSTSLQETRMEDWTPACNRNPSVSLLLWHVLQVPRSPFSSVRLNSGRRHCITHSEEQYCTWKIRKERSSAKRKTRKSFRYLPLISELSELNNNPHFQEEQLPLIDLSVLKSRTLRLLILSSSLSSAALAAPILLLSTGSHSLSLP